MTIYEPLKHVKITSRNFSLCNTLHSWVHYLIPSGRESKSTALNLYNHWSESGSIYMKALFKSNLIMVRVGLYKVFVHVEFGCGKTCKLRPHYAGLTFVTKSFVMKYIPKAPTQVLCLAYIMRTYLLLCTCPAYQTYHNCN